MNKKEMLVRLSVILSILIYLVLGYPDYYVFPKVTAIISSLMLYPLFGIVPVYMNNVIFVNLHDKIEFINISAECSGVLIIAIFIIVMFITPGIKPKHCFMSFMFVPLLIVANSFRIMSSIIIGHYLEIDSMLLYHSSIGQVIIFTSMVSFYIMFLKTFGYMRPVNNNIKIHDYDTKPKEA